MNGFKAYLLLLPDPSMLGDGFVLPVDTDTFAVALDHHLPMGAAHRHRVIVAVETHQRKVARPCCLHSGGLEGCCRQLQHHRQFLGQQRLLGPVLTPKTPFSILAARRLQPGIEFVQVAHLRHRHQEVGPAVADDPFDHTLLIAPGHPAEVFGKEVMTLELQEAVGQFAFPAPPKRSPCIPARRPARRTHRCRAGSSRRRGTS